MSTSEERKTFYPESEAEWLALREENVNSTEVAALFGCSPYTTLYELWHVKAGLLAPSFQSNERVVWGKRLEEAIAKGVAQDHNLSIRPMKEYVALPELRMGSSFDFAIGEDGCLEIKNVDAIQFKENWIMDGDTAVEPPVHLEFQCQHQLAVSGRKYVKLAALVGGNRVALIHRERDEEIIEAIKIKVSAFWNTIDAKKPPMPDFVEDAKAIAKIYGFSEKGKELVVGPDPSYATLVREYNDWGKQKKLAEDQQASVKGRLLMMIGDAERVVGDKWTISASMVKESVRNYVVPSYRNFRVYEKKEKK